jgi:hypothetical protein
MENMIPPEKIIEALSLLIDCYYNNLLIVSKYLITYVKVLCRLIQLLNHLERVEIRYNDFLSIC